MPRPGIIRRRDSINMNLFLLCRSESFGCQKKSSGK